MKMDAQESISLLKQAAFFLGRIEVKSQNCESLSKEVSIDTFFALGCELKACHTWILELQTIAEELKGVMSFDSGDEEAAFNLHLNRIFAGGRNFTTPIGLERVMELVNNIWGSSRKCLRAINWSISDLSLSVSAQSKPN